jgi:hypothetical protein
MIRALGADSNRVLPEERGVPEITVLELGAQGGYFGNSLLGGSHLAGIKVIHKVTLSFTP